MKILKIIKNNRLKDLDSVVVRDNQAVFDKAKEVLTRVIDNLDFINLKNCRPFDIQGSILKYINVAYTDEQLSSLCDYLFAAPFLVKLDDVEYYAMVNRIETAKNGIIFFFMVFK